MHRPPLPARCGGRASRRAGAARRAGGGRRGVGGAPGGGIRGCPRGDRQDQGGGADLEARDPIRRGRRMGGGGASKSDRRRGAMSELSHIGDDGQARMVDVGGKEPTERRARARARLRMAPETARAVEAGSGPKGEGLGVARLAGIGAAKQAGVLIPLAHPLPLSFVDVEATVDAEAGTVELVAEARTVGRTGVEMEAMTAAAVAALTVYDMVKGVERGVAIEEVLLLEKTGGKTDWSLE